MIKELREEVSQKEVTFKVEELEPLLSPPPMNIPKFEPCYVELKGKKMLIREMTLEEGEALLPYIQRYTTLKKDFYDIVGARVYAEILGWLRNRLKDCYSFVGLVDGKLAGFANGRLMNEDINISLHTMAFSRGMRAGACLYYAKCMYCFDVLDQKEFWATYESINGYKRWGLGMALPSYPWPDIQHELGGAKVFYLTKEYWDNYIKDYVKQMVGTEVKPATPDLLKLNEKMIIPDELAVE